MVLWSQAEGLPPEQRTFRMTSCNSSHLLTANGQNFAVIQEPLEAAKRFDAGAMTAGMASSAGGRSFAARQRR